MTGLVAAADAAGWDAHRRGLAVQSWVGHPRTGVLDEDDVEAIHAKVGSPADGVWPRRAGQKSDTTLRIQKFLNRRITEQKKG